MAITVAGSAEYLGPTVSGGMYVKKVLKSGTVCSTRAVANGMFYGDSILATDGELWWE